MMKTLANSEDKREILERLRSVGPASRRQWGEMTATEMICHCSDALKVAMGGKQPVPVSNWFSRTGMKWIALRTPVQWPHGVSTVPECEAGVEGTPPAEVESDLRELRELIDRFTKQPREYELQVHPIFGQLSEKEWMRWGYLHMDHHLRQFGA
jgi:Protein of unknown function (DUF1569)